MRLICHATLLSALALLGCGGGDRTFAPDDTGTTPDTRADSGGDSTPPDSGLPDSTPGDADTGSGDAGDSGDATPVPTGKQAIGNVAGGVKAESAKYILITTTGQAPGGNAVLQSSKYTLKGGVVGATQP